MEKRYLPPATTSLPALLKNGSDERFRAAIQAGWRSAQSLNAIMSVLATDVGISLPQYSMIMVLAYAQQGLSVGVLASELRVSQPFITAEIGKLVTCQLVFKRSNPADKRGVLVALTPKGRNTASRIASRLRDVNDMIYRDLTRKEFELIGRFIQRLSLRSELALQGIEAGYGSRSRGDQHQRR